MNAVRWTVPVKVFSVGLLACAVLLARPLGEAAEQGFLEGKMWTGTYKLSSHHIGTLHIGLESVRFVTMDFLEEESAAQYSGEVTELSTDGPSFTVRARFRQFKKSGAGDDEVLWQDVPGLFEVVIQGARLAEPDPAKVEVLIGSLAFSGDAEQAAWFVNKSGDAVLYRFWE